MARIWMRHVAVCDSRVQDGPVEHTPGLWEPYVATCCRVLQDVAPSDSPRLIHTQHDSVICGEHIRQTGRQRQTHATQTHRALNRSHTHTTTAHAKIHQHATRPWLSGLWTHSCECVCHDVRVHHDLFVQVCVPWLIRASVCAVTHSCECVCAMTHYCECVFATTHSSLFWVTWWAGLDEARQQDFNEVRRGLGKAAENRAEWCEMGSTVWQHTAAHCDTLQRTKWRKMGSTVW